MALTYGFYNSINHDRKYDAIQFGQIFDGLIKDGVYETYKKAMIVKESSVDNQVIIQPGRAWFDHTWSYNDTDYALNLPGPESYLYRIDAVVLDIDSTRSMRRNAFQYVTGTPTDNITSWGEHKPSLIKEDGHKQYPLCYIIRRGGQNHISASDIINAVGTSECPFVIGVIEGISIDDLLRRWNTELGAFLAGKKAEFNKYVSLLEADFFSWIENSKAQYYGFLDQQNTAWTNWFENIQYQLDGDVAGHLQMQIDNIAKFAHIYTIDKTLYIPMSGASIDDKTLIFAT